MKTLILDEKKWRCGEYSLNPENRRGKGRTRMKNYEGFECCLGQFSKQIDKTIKNKHLLGYSNPARISFERNKTITGLSVKRNGTFELTKLATEAMNINDDSCTSVEQKVKDLKRIFSKNGYKIVFKPMKRTKNAHL